MKARRAIVATLLTAAAVAIAGPAKAQSAKQEDPIPATPKQDLTAIQRQFVPPTPPPLTMFPEVREAWKETPAFLRDSKFDINFLSYFRDDHFVRALLPSVPDLEDIFLAALSIGNPGLPLSASVKTRVAPIAQAIEPILEPSQIDRLRGHFLRFVEDGGRTNLSRWATAVDFTAARAGLLLANDIASAHKVNQSPPLARPMAR